MSEEVMNEFFRVSAAYFGLTHRTPVHRRSAVCAYAEDPGACI